MADPRNILQTLHSMVTGEEGWCLTSFGVGGCVHFNCHDINLHPRMEAY